MYIMFIKIIAVPSEDHVKLVNPLCGQSVELLLNAEAGARAQ
jgi:hypothetical protein